MKKKIAASFLLLLLLSSCGLKTRMNNAEKETLENVTATEIQTVQNPEDYKNEYRGIWVNYNELSMKAESGGTAESFTEKIDNMFQNISSFGLNTVILQVRPFSDSFYKSSIFPWSAYLTGTQGMDISYDPLKIATEEAKKYNLKIEAWINPYRVSYEDNFDDLSDSNPAKQWYMDNPETDDLILTGNGIYYNPSSSRAQKLIIDGVREIVQNYDVSAIHMDDYFYPTTDEGIDKEQYSDYCMYGGTLHLDEWRRQNVNAFVSGLYSAIKSVNPNISVVISPGGDINKNYINLYADVKEWCKNSGYVDVIMPQLYYGFENESKPFIATADEWSKIVVNNSVRLCFGMSYYKSGTKDEYAGIGQNEWCENSDVCVRQIDYFRGMENYYGFSIFSYSYLFSDNKSEIAEKECQNIKNMLY